MENTTDKRKTIQIIEQCSCSDKGICTGTVVITTIYSDGAVEIQSGKPCSYHSHSRDSSST